MKWPTMKWSMIPLKNGSIIQLEIQKQLTNGTINECPAWWWKERRIDQWNNRLTWSMKQTKADWSMKQSIIWSMKQTKTDWSMINETTIQLKQWNSQSIYQWNSQSVDQLPINWSLNNHLGNEDSIHEWSSQSTDHESFNLTIKSLIN